MGDCPTLLVGQFAQSKIHTFLHICSFQKGNCAIALFVAHLKSGIALFGRSFKKCDCEIALFGGSFKKCDCVIALFYALLKSAIVRSHILVTFLKVQMCDCTFSLCSKVRQNVQTHNRSFEKSECAKMCKKRSAFPNRTFFVL